jgi:hypothetical protein
MGNTATPSASWQGHGWLGRNAASGCRPSSTSPCKSLGGKLGHAPHRFSQPWFTTRLIINRMRCFKRRQDFMYGGCSISHSQKSHRLLGLLLLVGLGLGKLGRLGQVGVRVHQGQTRRLSR